MRLSLLAGLAAALALAGVVAAIALRDGDRSPPGAANPDPAGNAAAPPAAGRPGATISDSALVLGTDGSPPGRVRVAAEPYRFEVAARSYRLGPDGIVIEGLSVRNATAAPAYEVRFYLLGPGLPPGGERAPIGDLAEDEASGPEDIAFPIAPGETLSEKVRFYLAYRVAADEPTWLLSDSHAIALRTSDRE